VPSAEPRIRLAGALPSGGVVAMRRDQKRRTKSFRAHRRWRFRELWDRTVNYLAAKHEDAFIAAARGERGLLIGLDANHQVTVTSIPRADIEVSYDGGPLYTHH
jgi:hypothetical protein